MTDLYRSADGVAVLERADGAPAKLEVTFARFGVWNRIRSWEGEFLERLQPGAFTETFLERGPAGSGMIRALFQHGRDAATGSKPLGPVVELREDPTGPVGVVELLDVPYVDAIRAGVEKGLYGASYRFGIRSGVEVSGESWVRNPGVSDHNPLGLPERTITAANVSEFGPVTFPADEGTNAAGMVGVRSLDQYFSDRLSAAEDQGAGVRVAADSDDQSAVRAAAVAAGHAARLRAQR